MKIRKNKKRIDPRYFLHETAFEGDEAEIERVAQGLKKIPVPRPAPEPSALADRFVPWEFAVANKHIKLFDELYKLYQKSAPQQVLAHGPQHGKTYARQGPLGAQTGSDIHVYQHKGGSTAFPLPGDVDVRPFGRGGTE
jgi:hypothetical protein